ncbi:unnamed protein product, partial [Didymodactylos carnosus]
CKPKQMTSKTNLIIFVAIVAVMLLGCNGTIARTTQTTTALVKDGITTEEYSNGQFASTSEASIIRTRRCECPWWVRGCCN